MAGDILLVEAPRTPTGRSTHPHYFVVMHIPQPLVIGGVVSCLGISSIISDEKFNPEQHVKMRWQARKGGHPETGLYKPSIAKVTFPHKLDIRRGRTHELAVEARHEGRFIRSDHLQTLTALANAYNRMPR